ncbi:MAG: 4'-phosphopantetheinyl transferase superfamily protein [Burkholderiaceae bacterium]|nr:4'-phosphopantetheinyl transferase superfamily protein [Burkholderiaceae bacterium]
MRPGALPVAPAPDEAQLFLLSLDDPPWPSDTLYALLDAHESARAARFHFAQHRLRFAHGRGVLRRLLAPAPGLAPAALRFELGAEGKPRLAAAMARPTLDFNLSHCEGWALVGLSDGAAIGVDIELPRPVSDWAVLAAQHFAPAEQQALAALPADVREDAFLAGWTRKEAFVKALGGGLAVALDSFEVTLDPYGPARLASSSDPAHPAAAFSLWAGRPPWPMPGGWAAAAVRARATQWRLYRCGPLHGRET